MRDYYSFVRAVRDGCLSANVEQPTAECLAETVVSGLDADHSSSGNVSHHRILAFATRRNFGGTR